MKKNFFVSFFDLINRKRLTTVAGAWVYYFLTAFVPLLFLVVSAFSVFGVSLTHDLVSRLPEEFRLAGEKVVETAENSSKGATIFFIIAVVFSCTNLLNQMSKDGDFIYEARSKIKRGIFRRLWAIVALAMLFVLFLGVAFLFAFSSNINLKAFLNPREDIFVTIFVFLFTIILGYAIIYVLNKFISPLKMGFSGLAIGALVALFIMVIGTIGFIIYLKFFSNYNAFYGSLAGIIIFLVWAYILMLGLSFGAIINMQLYKHKKDKKKAKKL
ncbi:MAG: YihY/virulence factor BrkB family protein [Clostridiales bacterium]|nr:YihY/virulence factor BrkB family protein [Clostridiales bacterium]